MKTMKKSTGEMLVSQSMIKAMLEYKAKELCGLVLESKYVTGTFPNDGDDSPEKKLGRYFEFILTGSMGRHGQPVAEYTASGMKKHERLRLEEDMTAHYQLAHKNARRVKEYFKKMKIKILPDQVNVHIQRGGMEGTIDLIVMYRGVRVVIDVKYSGLIGDKWSKMGWTMTDEQKVYHGIQAHQYHYLASGIPFFFLVVSSKNEDDIEFIEAEFTDFSLEQHHELVNFARKELKFGMDFKFTPYPELVRCKKCAIREGCAFRQEVPTVRKVKLAA
jgi:hypothetical protein